MTKALMFTKLYLFTVLLLVPFLLLFALACVCRTILLVVTRLDKRCIKMMRKIVLEEDYMRDRISQLY